MFRISTIALVVFWATVSVASVALADEVVLENGDRLSGKIVRLVGGKLAIKTSYSAKLIEIDASKVKSIKTDAPVEMHLAGGEVIRGKLNTGEGGVITAERSAGRGPVAVDWTKVEAVNPSKRIWHGSVTVAASDQGGNTERASATVAAEAQRRTERDRFKLRCLYNYAEEDDQMTSRNVFGAAKYDYFFTKKLYGYLSEELFSDEFRDLELRAVTGAGVGWQVVDKPELSFSAEVGAAHVNEDFETGEDDSRIAARLAGSLKWTIFKKVTFTDEVVYLPSMEDDHYQLRNEAALTTPLGAGWSLKFANIFEYDNQPPIGIHKTDRTWLLGLQYKF
jgi:putative salt-induced outer membrane protein YdiY